MKIDDVERSFLQEARDQFQTSDSAESSALKVLKKRIAAAPLAALPGLELPPIPDLASASVAATGASSAAAATGASSATAAATASSIAASGTAALSMGAGATATASKGLVVGALLQLAPVKILATVLLVGAGATGVTMISSAPSSSEVSGQAKSGEVTPKRTQKQPRNEAVLDSRARKVSLDAPSKKESLKAAEVSPPAVPSKMRRQGSRQRPSLSNSSMQHEVAAPAVATFNDELSYLRRAQGALKTGNAPLAWKLMKTLDTQLPGGALVPERRMTKVLALCSLGRVKEASKIADQVSRSSSGPLYAARLRSSCALPSK